MRPCFKVLLGGWCLVGTGAVSALEDGSQPDVPAVLERLVTRARQVSALTNAPTYVYEKRGLYEFRRPDGSLRHLKEKVYEVRLYRGMTRNRLIRVDSRELAPEESQRETEGERRWRSAYTAGRTAFRDERMEDVLNKDLLARFEFQFEGRELVRGRPTISLTFRPKSADLPNERLIDRVINKLEGRIRVDEGDDEIVQAEARTVGRLRLWGGLLGTLDFFQLRLDRERAASGVWYNHDMDDKFTMHLEGVSISLLPSLASVQSGSRCEHAPNLCLGGFGEEKQRLAILGPGTSGPRTHLAELADERRRVV